MLEEDFLSSWDFERLWIWGGEVTEVMSGGSCWLVISLGRCQIAFIWAIVGKLGLLPGGRI